MLTLIYCSRRAGKIEFRRLTGFLIDGVRFVCGAFSGRDWRRGRRFPPTRSTSTLLLLFAGLVLLGCAETTPLLEARREGTLIKATFVGPPSFPSKPRLEFEIHDGQDVWVVRLKDMPGHEKTVFEYGPHSADLEIIPGTSIFAISIRQSNQQLTEFAYDWRARAPVDFGPYRSRFLDHLRVP